MELEHGSKDSKHPGIVIDESGKISQSNTSSIDVVDGSREVTPPKRPVEVSNGRGDQGNQSETRQLETPSKVSNGSGEIKLSDTYEKVYDKSGEGKKSETHPRVYDESEEIWQLEAYAKVSADRSEESKHLETSMKILEDNKEIKHSKTPTIFFDGSEEGKQPETTAHFYDAIEENKLSSEVADKRVESKQSEATPKVSDGSEVSEKLETLPKVNVEMSDISKAEEAAAAKGSNMREPSDRLLSFTSSSSSGSDTSMDDLFQVDATRLSTSSPIPPLPNSSYDDAPRLSNVTPTDTPPGIQVMDRYEGYDPNRIPASVFETSKDTDWSMASNESLFSIHLGNTSFSRDHAALMLGELTPTKSSDFFGLNTPRTPPSTGGGTQIDRIEEGRESAADEMADDPNSIKNKRSENHRVWRTTPPDKSHAHSLAPSHRSDSAISGTSGISGASAKSFAFPILGDGTDNSIGLGQDFEEQYPELLKEMTITEKPKRKSSSWFPCFSCCCGNWSCSGCFSWCSCHRSCCSGLLCCSCPRCFHRPCFCF